MYGTQLSLVLGNTEKHQTAVREYPEASGEMIVLQSKVGFSPDLESTRLWERDFKRQATLGQRLQISEYGLQVLGVSCSLLTCAALRMICCSRHH